MLLKGIVDACAHLVTPSRQAHRSRALIMPADQACVSHSLRRNCPHFGCERRRLSSRAGCGTGGHLSRPQHQIAEVSVFGVMLIGRMPPQ